MPNKLIAGAVALVLAGSLAASTAEARSWRHHGGGGGAIAGFAAGAIIGGALAAQRPYYGYGPTYYYDDRGYYDAPAYVGGRDAVGYCMSRFRSYDPGSGTYLGYDGMRHPCP